MQRAHHELRRVDERTGIKSGKIDRGHQSIKDHSCTSASTIKASEMSSLFEAVMHWIHRDKPMDKQQLEAAQDRLHDRTKKMGEATDALTEMLKRMRREDNNNSRKRKQGNRK